MYKIIKYIKRDVVIRSCKNVLISKLVKKILLTSSSINRIKITLSSLALSSLKSRFRCYWTADFHRSNIPYIFYVNNVNTKHQQVRRTRIYLFRTNKRIYRVKLAFKLNRNPIKNKENFESL